MTSVEKSPRNFNNCLPNYIKYLTYFQKLLKLRYISLDSNFLSLDFPLGRHFVPPSGEVAGEKNLRPGDNTHFNNSRKQVNYYYIKLDETENLATIGKKRSVHQRFHQTGRVVVVVGDNGPGVKNFSIKQAGVEPIRIQR